MFTDNHPLADSNIIKEEMKDNRVFVFILRLKMKAFTHYLYYRRVQLAYSGANSHLHTILLVLYGGLWDCWLYSGLS